jgi:hypothetical protein
MVMVFNRATGDYKIFVLAEPSHPFAGSYRVAINLYNQDLGTSSEDPAFFSALIDEFWFLGSDTTTMQALCGTNLRLKSWRVGNRVFTNSLGGTGNPEGCYLFRSSVSMDFGWETGPSREDVIAWSSLATPMVATKAPNPSWKVSQDLTEAQCRKIAGL